jgi:hypothetical protein
MRLSRLTSEDVGMAAGDGIAKVDAGLSFVS